MNILMGLLPLVLYAAITIVVIIIYRRTRRKKEEEYFKPLDEIECIHSDNNEERFATPLQLKQKVGYTAPIVGIVIGAVFSAFIIGIFVVIISLVVLVSRVNFNKRVDSWNAIAMMKYQDAYVQNVEAKNKRN